MSQFFPSLERPSRYPNSADIDDVWPLAANLNVNGSNSPLVLHGSGKGSFYAAELMANDGAGEMESIVGVFVGADLHSVNHLMEGHHRIHGLSINQQLPITPGCRRIKTTPLTLGKLPILSNQAQATPPE
jgi:hypothetical protein